MNTKSPAETNPNEEIAKYNFRKGEMVLGGTSFEASTTSPVKSSNPN